MTEVERWDVWEVALTSKAAYANPFRDVDLKAVFVHGATGRTVELDGFYDGDDVWRVRFMPAEEGVWRYRTRCRDEELDGVEGELTCVPAEKPYLHGPVGARGHAFFHADGTRRLVISGRSYMHYTYAPPVRDRMIALLKDYGINRFFFMMQDEKPFTMRHFAGHHLYLYGHQNGAYDFSRYNLAKYRLFDAYIDACRKQDILVSPYLFYYNDGQQRNMTSEEEDQYIRYTVARFGAYGNVLFVLGNEIEQRHTERRGPRPYAMDVTYPWSNEKGALLAELAARYGHTATVHNPMEHTATNPSYFTALRAWPFARWTGCVLKQAQVAALGGTEAVDDAHAEPQQAGPFEVSYGERAWARHNAVLIDLRETGQPVINEEPGYEMGGGPEGSCFPSQNAESIRRTFWTAAMAGAHAVWTGGWHHQVFSAQSVSLVGMLEAGKYIRVFRDVVESLPFEEMAPRNDLVSGEAVVVGGEPFRTVFCLAREGEVYAVYALNGGRGQITLAAGTYAQEVVNPRDGTRQARSAVAGGRDVTFDLPSLGRKPNHRRDPSDWVLVLRRT